ncbi:putative mfs monocarboxylate transporter protein [Botrytis fragariae]|uniref:Putative mfs monocarboxylate transporter protein n=1 Tax=Botrytis fragariae TaxID=1964551 RepID=A0A8H6AQ25_9HELO|nr:putative mfs monocarboxylate transporter protein [Botrytis fragariae]KAF5871399.1 putative mfs monocarboxylate transporter protein [Botrytis fragariae]
MLVEPRSATDAPAPDGGFVAWSLDYFQAYYETDYPSWTSSQISWIGSIQAFFLFGFSIVAGLVIDRGYLRYLVWIGCFLCVLATMLTSISSEYWHFILAQGVMFGIGSGLFIPALLCFQLILTRNKHRLWELQLLVFAGGMVFPIVFNHLQPRIGFGWSICVVGFIILFAATIPVLGIHVRTPPSAVRKIFDTKAGKEPPFLVTSAYIPPFYVQLYALDTNIVGGDLVPYLSSLLNAGSFFGRIIPTHFADTYGPFNIDVICVLVSGILAFTWITIHSTASMILSTISYGFFSGVLTSIYPNLGIALSPDAGVLSFRLGMLLMPISAGILVVNLTAGALESYGWISLQIFTAALLTASLLVVIVARILMYGKSLTIRCSKTNVCCHHFTPR